MPSSCELLTRRSAAILRVVVADKLQNILKSLPAAPVGFIEPMLLRPTDALPEGAGWQ
jgi:hypothetical protein